MTQAGKTPAASSWRHEHQHPSTPASTIRFPNPPPERRITEFCGGHGPGETPGPIPNPEAKPWHGDGTMPERTWESSTPPQPHFTEGPGNTRSPGLRISQATHHTGKRAPFPGPGGQSPPPAPPHGRNISHRAISIPRTPHQTRRTTSPDYFLPTYAPSAREQHPLHGSEVAPVQQSEIAPCQHIGNGMPIR